MLNYDFSKDNGAYEYRIRKGHSKDRLPGDDLIIVGEYLEVQDSTLNVLFRVRIKEISNNPNYKTLEDIMKFLLEGANIKNLNKGTVKVSNGASRKMREISNQNRYRYINRDQNGCLRKGGINS